MFDFNDSRYTHMPFACPNADGKPEEFCCIMVNGVWKLHHFTGIKWKRIRTGLPADATECGPCAEFEDGIWKVSFIAGGARNGREFKLYRLLGISGKTEPMVQCSADVGFVWKNSVVSAGRRSMITIVEPMRTLTLEMHNVEYLYRVSYNPFNPSQLLISGQHPRGEIFSWAYQPGLEKLYAVIADGVPAYKAAFYKNDCYYATRNAKDDFEQRRIVKAQNFVLDELDAKTHITLTMEFTYSRSPNMEFE